MFADEEYDKAATEFRQIPLMLDRKRQLGSRLLPNEVFAERRVRCWIDYAGPDRVLDGSLLKTVVTINPLWELLYLWNGVSQLSHLLLHKMRSQFEKTLDRITKDRLTKQSDYGRLNLMLGVVSRELGSYDFAETCFQRAAVTTTPSDDSWVIPYTMYELATLRCFRLQDHSLYPDMRQTLLKEACGWIRRAEHFQPTKESNDFHRSSTSSSSTNITPFSSYSSSLNSTPAENGDSDWESRLHVRCQLLSEKLDELSVRNL